MKKSRNLYINNCFLIAKTEGNRQYIGLFFAENYVIYPKSFFEVKDIVRISPYMIFCLSFENLFQQYPLGFNVAETQNFFNYKRIIR